MHFYRLSYTLRKTIRRLTGWLRCRIGRSNLHLAPEMCLPNSTIPGYNNRSMVLLWFPFFASGFSKELYWRSCTDSWLHCIFNTCFHSQFGLFMPTINLITCTQTMLCIVNPEYRESENRTIRIISAFGLETLLETLTLFCDMQNFQATLRMFAPMALALLRLIFLDTSMPPMALALLRFKYPRYINV